MYVYARILLSAEGPLKELLGRAGLPVVAFGEDWRAGKKWVAGKKVGFEVFFGLSVGGVLVRKIPSPQR